MQGGGLSPGPWTSRAHSSPHWPGFLLWGQRDGGGSRTGVEGVKAPLVSCKELETPWFCCYSLKVALRAGTRLGLGGADGEEEGQFRLLRALSLEWGLGGATQILDPLQAAREPKRTGSVSTHPLLTQAACCCHGDSNTNLLPAPPPTAVRSPAKGGGCLFLVVKGTERGKLVCRGLSPLPLPRLSWGWSLTLRVWGGRRLGGHPLRPAALPRQQQARAPRPGRQDPRALHCAAHTSLEEARLLRTEEPVGEVIPTQPWAWGSSSSSKAWSCPGPLLLKAHAPPNPALDDEV